MRLAILCLGGLAACGGTSGPARLYGEVHVHQFSGGVHPAASFIAQPVAADRVNGDSVLIDPRTPVARAGGCALFDATTVGGPLLEVPRFVSAGPVHLRGGVRDVDLTFDAGRSEYQTAALPDEVFAGDEMLTVSAEGDVAPGFRGQLRAPEPLMVSAPESLAAWNRVIEWKASHATRIFISIDISRTDGSWAQIQCVVADSPGRFTVPAELWQRVPAAPRNLNLWMSRDQLARIASGGGEGVVLHAGYEFARSGAE